MSLKDIYYSLEDKYFDFLDWLEGKGINLYKVIDPLEKKGIPTFAIFSLIILGIIALIVVNLLGPAGVSSPSDLTLTFTDDVGMKIPNATIDLTLSAEAYTVHTGLVGNATISGLETNRDYTLEINDSQYTADPTIVNLSESQNYTIRLSEAVSVVTKTISFKDQLSKSLVTNSFTASFTCSDNSNYQKSDVEIINGQCTLSDVPVDCGELIPDISGYEVIDSAELGGDNRSGSVFLSEAGDLATGALTVRVIDKDTSMSIAGMQITIVDMRGITQNVVTANSNGQATINSLNVGQYYVYVYDINGVYGEISQSDYLSGSQTAVVVSSNSTASAQIALQKDVVGSINLKAIDSETSEPISNATVKLFKGYSSTPVITQTTGADGIVKLNVKENLTYRMTIDQANYIIAQKDVKIDSAVQIIALTRISQNNFRGVFVNVTDTGRTPIEFANLKVIDISSNDVVKNAVADVRGSAVISNLDLSKTYKIEATVGKYTGSSNPFSVADRSRTDVNIVVEIGEGTYYLNIVDSTGTSVATNVTVYDVVSNREIEGKATTTDTSGNTIIRVRADKTIFFVVNNGDSKFITKSYNLEANSRMDLKIALPKTANASNIEFVGLYGANDELMTTVSSGQSVKAKFLLNINKNYSKVVAHIRTGNGDACDGVTHTAEEDDIYISQISSASQKITGSASYTPCTGEQKDLSLPTKKDGKWFNVILDNPIQGTYLIEATLVILDSASNNLPLYYRAEFNQGSSMLRYPVDSKLGISATASGKDSLYAYAKQATIYTGSNNFCNSDVCYSFSMFNESSKITRNIVDSYNVKTSTKHRLFFSVNTENKSFSNVSLNLTTGSSLVLDKYTIVTAGSQTLSSNEGFENIDLGALTANDHISGEIWFTVIGDSSDTINFNLMSAGESILSNSIAIDVDPAKAINLELVPRTFIPFVANNVIVALTDDTNRVVSNAQVNVKLDSQLIASGSTDKNGAFGFVIPAPEVGSKVDVAISKEGYKAIATTYTVNDNLLTSVPESIDVALDLSKAYSDERSIALVNNTATPLAVTAIKNNLDNKYVELSAISGSILIEPGEQTNLDIKTLLTESGIGLLKQQLVSGDIQIIVSSAELSRSWTVEIPVNVRITFGTGLDNLDCLTIDPATLEIRAEPNESVDYTFKLVNECTVGQSSIGLGTVFAGIDWENYKELGTVSLFVNAKEYILADNEPVQILSMMAQDANQTIKLVFKAYQINSGSAEPKIYFRSKRPNISGVDQVTSEMTANIIVNKYSECLVLPQGTIALQSCYINSGYGMYQSVFGYNPLMTSGYGTSTAYGNTTPSYNLGYMYNTTSVNPLTGLNTNQYSTSNGYVNNNMSTLYPYNYPNNYYNSGYGYDFFNMMDSSAYGLTGLDYSNQMGCPQQKISVTNKCSEDVDVKMNCDYGLNITDGELTVAKGDTEQVTIQAANQMGTFNIDVSAKPSNTNEDYELVKQIPVSVSLPVQYIPSGCITLTKKNFDFSGLVEGYEKTEVVNSCFDQGYRLLQVQFKELSQLQYDGVYFLNIQDPLGVVAPLQKRISNTSDGQRVEIWTIELRRSPDINKLVFDKYVNKYGTEAGGIVTSIRTIGFDLGMNIDLQAVLTVAAITPNNQIPQSTIDFMVTLKDNLQWLSIANKENFKLFGDIMNALDQFGAPTDKITQVPEIGTKTPASSEAPKAPETPSLSSTPNQPGAVGAGQAESSEDAITFTSHDVDGKLLIMMHVKEEYLKKEKFTKVDDSYARECFTGNISKFGLQGLTDNSYINNSQSTYFYNGSDDKTRVLVELGFPEKGKFNLCFLRPVEELTTEEAKVYKRFPGSFDIYEPKWFILKDKILYENIMIGVDGGLDKSAISVASEISGIYDKSEFSLKDGECLDSYGFETKGFTGEANYKLYGFDRLLFTWDPTKITETTCDIGNYYCDQTQMYMAISKKWDVITTEKENTIKLGTVIFERTSSEGSIKKLEQISPTMIDLRSSVTSAFSGKNIDQYVDASRKVLAENIPSDLQQMTIITISNSSDSGISDNDFEENYVKKIFGSYPENYYKSEVSGKNYYQFTVAQYILKMDLSSLTLSDTTNRDNFNKFLAQFYSSMDVYYGVSLNWSLMNIKPFGDLKSQENQEMMQKKFFGNKSDLDVTMANNLNISEPGTYVVILSTKDQSYKVKVSIEEKADAKLDEFVETTSKKYLSNLLFKTLINATYFDYKGVPFTNSDMSGSNSLPNSVTAINYDSYKYWDNFQDGYLFKLTSSKNGYGIVYSNTRPIKFIDGTEISYNLSHNGKTIGDTRHKWILGTPSSSNKLIEFDSYDSKNSYNNLSVSRNIKQMMTTFFVLANDSETKKSGYQLDVKSSTPLSFDYDGVKMDSIRVDQTLKYIYHIPSTLPKDISDTKFQNLSDYKTVGDLIKGITDESICFSIKDGSIAVGLWVNNSQSDIIQVNNNFDDRQLS